VSAGDLIGLVGSSGSSSDAHLHWRVTHHGATVEPQFDASNFFVDPFPYQGDLVPSILDLGVTNEDPASQAKEHPSDISEFPASYNGEVWFWYRLSHLRAGDSLAIRWYLPNGTLNHTYNYTATGSERFGFHRWVTNRDWASSPGEWNVAVEVNSVEIARTGFSIVAGAAPDASVTQNGTRILDERTTPVDFGSSGLGTSVRRLFTIENSGYNTLNLGTSELPPGFSLSGIFPPSVAASGSASFTVELDTSRAGEQFGALRFTTNDPDHPVFNFNVAGTVTGSAPATAPVIALPDAQLAYRLGQTPQFLDTTATLTDSDSSNFNGGSLTVEFASGGTSNDRLTIVGPGGAGQIGVSGSDVTFDNTVIGSFFRRHRH